MLRRCCQPSAPPTSRRRHVPDRRLIRWAAGSRWNGSGLTFACSVRGSSYSTRKPGRTRRRWRPRSISTFRILPPVQISPAGIGMPWFICNGPGRQRRALFARPTSHANQVGCLIFILGRLFSLVYFCETAHTRTAVVTNDYCSALFQPPASITI